MNDKDSRRLLTLDLLRVAAMLGVVAIHTSVASHFDFSPTTDWETRNVFNLSLRWSVPVFVMVSGALFLNQAKPLSLRVLYRRYISRIACVFLFWSAVYAVYHLARGDSSSSFVAQIVAGPYHFWFLKMLTGLYVVLPLLRLIVTDRRAELYFLCVSLLSAFVAPLLLNAAQWAGWPVAAVLSASYDDMHLDMCLGFTGYFVLGHYLHTHPLGKGVRRAVYLLAVASLFAAVVLTNWFSMRTGRLCNHLYGELNPFTLAESAAVFLLSMHHAHRVPLRCRGLVSSLARLSLGIYAIHVLVMFVAEDCLSTDVAAWHAIWFVPVGTVTVFALSAVLSFLLSKVPNIRRLVC